MDYTESFDAYAPTRDIDADKDVTNGPMTTVKDGNNDPIQSIPMNIHRGDPLAQQIAIGLMGLDAPLAAYGYADPTFFATDTDRDAALKHRNVLMNADGEAWSILGRPSVRTRFPETAHVKCLLTRLTTQRPGLPTVTP